ncbi:hypothetical protein RFI_23125 [Reticulomyxa filosa]|uniref:Uncharacterized protein n=1 Tax=Reticulomyxa filosa TaxID=46433 RepID=X6MLA8_RETFI|nr:hypothetical protein RFI_23125 [Reticulomyxa filosa]|eukprot:ETO14242.1 hypothetical protein RFI_23125 [Reticulomyxa filosa]
MIQGLIIKIYLQGFETFSASCKKDYAFLSYKERLTDVYSNKVLNEVEKYPNLYRAKSILIGSGSQLQKFEKKKICKNKAFPSQNKKGRKYKQTNKIVYAAGVKMRMVAVAMDRVMVSWKVEAKNLEEIETEAEKQMKQREQSEKKEQQQDKRKQWWFQLCVETKEQAQDINTDHKYEEKKEESGALCNEANKKEFFRVSKKKRYFIIENLICDCWYAISLQVCVQPLENLILPISSESWTKPLCVKNA